MKMLGQLSVVGGRAVCQHLHAVVSRQHFCGHCAVFAEGMVSVSGHFSFFFFIDCVMFAPYVVN